MSDFADQLKQMRKKAGITQAELSEDVGISNTYISALESGRKSPPPRRLVEQLARALGGDSQALWAVARVEREALLQPRIEGEATSSRRRAETRRGLQANASLPGQANRPVEKSPEEEGDLEQALDALAKVLRNENTRTCFLESVQSIIDDSKEG